MRVPEPRFLERLNKALAKWHLNLLAVPYCEQGRQVPADQIRAFVPDRLKEHVAESDAPLTVNEVQERLAQIDGQPPRTNTRNSRGGI